MAAISLFLYTNMAAVTSVQTLYSGKHAKFECNESGSNLLRAQIFSWNYFRLKTFFNDLIWDMFLEKGFFPEILMW